MITNFYRASLLVAALLLVGAGKASADTILSYSFTGTTTVTFELSQTPTPTAVDPGFGFVVTPINLMINGAPSNDFLAFYNVAVRGGFGAFACGSCVDLSVSGPQLYSGSEANPTMLLLSGVNLPNFPGGPGGGTISNMNPNSTPEPSAFLLLGLGLVALVGTGLAAKRFGRLPVSAS
jgi:hypothetical protein